MHLSILPLVALAATSSAQLHQLAVAKGLEYFGSATDNGELSDAPYKAILSDTREFGQLTPGNAQKWAYSEPQPGVFSHNGGDEIVRLAEANGQKLRCHTLVWHSQAPDWVTYGTWTNATLIAAMKRHIKGMMEHYKGKCYHWDVVNEAFEEDGSYRKSVFSDIIGPEFIPIAFQEAALYDPDTKLYYNDYNLEYNGAKAEAARKMVANLKSRGIKIDGVGFQAHMIVNKTPGRSDLANLLKSYTDLGVEVAYTELDVRHESLPPNSAALAKQDSDFGNLVGSCLDVAKCIGITIWDYTDKYSWIPSVFTGNGDALLWDKNLVKKQVYYAVATVLGAGSTTSTTTVRSTTTAIQTTPISSPTTTRTTLTTTTRSVTTTTTTTTTRAPTTSSIPNPGIGSPRWGQCGGLGWTGPKTCQSPWTCKYSNDWYSQCL